MKRYFVPFCDFGREAIEQIPVKRLVLKLVENSERTLISNAIVAFSDGLYALAAHSICPIAAR